MEYKIVVCSFIIFNQLHQPKKLDVYKVIGLKVPKIWLDDKIHN